jgi:hypothetical protein
MTFKEEFTKRGNSAPGEYHKLLNMFFLGLDIDISTPAMRSLPAAIDRWLSVLHIDFTAYNYAITIKDMTKRGMKDAEALSDFTISMDVLSEDEEGVHKTPI